MSDVKVLRPFMSFNTAEITEAWAREWGEEPGEEREDWELLNWHVLVDGKLALIYVLYDKVASDADTHNVNHYRILVYDMVRGMNLVEKRRFKLDDAYLYQVYYRDDELWTIERNSHTNNYYTLPTWPVRDTGRGFQLFYDITDVAIKSDGTLVVGYSTQCDKEERVSLIEFGNGRDRRYMEDRVLMCECVSLDKDEDNWGFMVPQMEFIHFMGDDLETYVTEMAGFNKFCLSDDKNLLLADYSTNKSDDRLYLMTKTEENVFGDAVECVVEDDHKGWLCLPKTMKNWMVFRKGDWLLAVDVNECCAGIGGKEDLKEEIGFKTETQEARKPAPKKKENAVPQPKNRVIGFQMRGAEENSVA